MLALSHAPLNTADHYQLIDDLETAIVDLARQIDTTLFRYLELIREFDERRGWLAYGYSDCAHWLSHRCAVSLQTAHDHLRVALALKDLPTTSAGLRDGTLSYSKVRALVRLATPANEAGLIAFAKEVTASTLEHRIRELKNGEAGSAADARHVQEARSLKRTVCASTGMVKLEVVLPAESGELVMKALEQATVDEDPIAPSDYFARQADALVDLARAYLAGSVAGSSVKKTSGTADHYQVLIHVDESALRGVGGRADLPLESVRRLLCDSGAVPLVENGDGHPLSVGRKQRTVPPAIRRALLARDRHCGFPGCTHERYLDAHHVRHWADGGSTGVDNLVLLCTQHHRAVHEGGFHLRRDAQGDLYFLTPRGKAIPACGRYETLDVGAEGVSAESRRPPADAGVSAESRQAVPGTGVSAETTR